MHVVLSADNVGTPKFPQHGSTLSSDKKNYDRHCRPTMFDHVVQLLLFQQSLYYDV